MRIHGRFPKVEESSFSEEKEAKRLLLLAPAETSRLHSLRVGASMLGVAEK
jgi:hypothetical protein